MESRKKMNQIMMFNSEVEQDKFLGSTDVIQDAYQAILDTFSNYKIHPNRPIPDTSSTSDQIDKKHPENKILAFNSSFPDYTLRFLTGKFNPVSSINNKVVDFISTDVNPEFSINEAAVELFDQLSVELPEILNQVRNGPLIVTGQGLGGYLAILYALWHQHAIDVEESNGAKNVKRPICITFGSPLLGDELLRCAIAERPQWKASFLNVVAKTDPVASFFSSNTSYKPFGTFLFCTESGGHTSFEDEEAIMVVLDAMASSNVGNNTQVHDYRNELGLIRKKVMYRGASTLGQFDLHKNPLRAGVVVQFQGIGLLNDNSHDLIAKTENSRAKMIKEKRRVNAYEPTKKLNDMKISLTYMEWYMKIRKQKGGYYDSYKLSESKHEIEGQQEIIKHHVKLNKYWKEFVEEKNLKPQKDGAKLRKRWLFGGTNYRRIVEPLDIAYHYKNGNKDYMSVRPNHYKLLEKWSEADKNGQEPKKTKAASLTEDSCFWANVEEALIKLGKLKNGDHLNFAAELEQFEKHVLKAIKDSSLSPDVFVEGSSLMKWWREYKAYKGNEYNSDFALYMNSESYKDYK